MGMEAAPFALSLVSGTLFRRAGASNRANTVGELQDFSSLALDSLPSSTSSFVNLAICPLLKFVHSRRTAPTAPTNTDLQRTAIRRFHSLTTSRP